MIIDILNITLTDLIVSSLVTFILGFVLCWFIRNYRLKVHKKTEEHAK